jgi:hypothetical protein
MGLPWCLPVFVISGIKLNRFFEICRKGLTTVIPATPARPGFFKTKGAGVSGQFSQILSRPGRAAPREGGWGDGRKRETTVFWSATDIPEHPTKD